MDSCGDRGIHFERAFDGPGSRLEVVLVADVAFDGEIVNGAFEDGPPLGERALENLACDATVAGSS